MHPDRDGVRRSAGQPGGNEITAHSKGIAFELRGKLPGGTDFYAVEKGFVRLGDAAGDQHQIPAPEGGRQFDPAAVPRKTLQFRVSFFFPQGRDLDIVPAGVVELRCGGSGKVAGMELPDPFQRQFYRRGGGRSGLQRKIVEPRLAVRDEQRDDQFRNSGGKLKSEGTGVPILRTGEGGGAAENSFAVPLPGDFQSGALFPEGSAIPACERIIARLGIFNPLQIGAFFSGRGGDEGAAAVVAAVFGEAALGLFAVTPLFPAQFRFKGGIDQLRRRQEAAGR